MMPIARLRIIGGVNAGLEFNIEKDGSYILGRADEADFQVRDMMASRRHAVLTIKGDLAVVEDLGSTNGTMVNGKPIKRQELRSGDRITIGSTDIEFIRVLTAPKAPPKPSAAQSHKEPTKPMGRTDVGRVIAGFKILERLGGGGMGTVYKALQLSMNRIVAFKVLKVTTDDPERSIREFKREAQVGAQLQHPNIVTFYDAGYDKGVYFIAMEFIQGVPVDKILEEQGAMDVKQALDVIIQVTDAVCYMFGRGIIHRDIKPSNIMVTPTGIAKLTDFGLAKCYQRAGMTGFTRVGEGKGTLEYMPPEQITNALYCDQRADIYAIGATLYDMLTGYPPFSGSLRELIDAIERKYPVPIKHRNPAVPDYVSRIVEKCMRKKPEERYQFPDELLRDLKGAWQRLTGEPYSRFG
ncbi:MAG: hypothetical protein DRP82_05915 [Planctomycetota bacterium]|nr:MAG: hypothetical protein DRP82_05915 [Planctomycetota bacterium]